MKHAIDSHIDQVIGSRVNRSALLTIARGSRGDIATTNPANGAELSVVAASTSGTSKASRVGGLMRLAGLEVADGFGRFAERKVSIDDRGHVSVLAADGDQRSFRAEGAAEITEAADAAGVDDDVVAARPVERIRTA
jgi:hypothetical protein